MSEKGTYRYTVAVILQDRVKFDPRQQIWFPVDVRCATKSEAVKLATEQARENLNQDEAPTHNGLQIIGGVVIGYGEWQK